MKKNLVVITLLSVFAASTGFAQSSDNLTKETEPAKAAPADATPAETDNINNTGDVDTKTSGKIADEHLPGVKLSPGVLAGILNSEIAFQRGKWQSAYVTLLSLAQQTRDPRLARRAADMALSTKRPAEALNAIRLWRELAPDSDEASQYYLGFIMLSNNLAEAQPILAQRLQRTDPQQRGMLILQTQRLLSRSPDKATAFLLLENLVRPYSAMFEAHIALAQAAFANNNMQRANQESDQAIKLNPGSELAILTAVQVSPDQQTAEKLLTTFLQEYPKSREIRIAYARLLIEQKQYEKAREQFDVLYRDNTEDTTTLLALGLLNAQIGDITAAEKYLADYVDQLAEHPESGRDNTQALLILAQLAIERKDTESALKWLSQVEPGEGYFDAQLKRAEITARTGDTDGARRILAGIETDKESEEALVARVDAQILQESHNYIAALHVLEIALKAHSENTDLLYDYAIIAEKLNNLNAMEIALRKVIRLAPNKAPAYNALGYAFAERHMHLPEALTLIKKALSLTPKDPFIMDSMGWVQYRLGNLAEAERYLRAAYSVQQDNEIMIHLAEVLWVKGYKQDAQKLWREVYNKDPESQLLNKTLQRLQVTL